MQNKVYKMDDFEYYCQQLNQICISLQESEKEYVSENDAFLAYLYVKNMYLGEEGDILLYCAALNLLNTYVKQKDSKITYKFKREIGYLLGLAVNAPCEKVQYDLQMDGHNSLFVAKIGDVIFSFHNIPLSYDLRVFEKSGKTVDIEWDGVRKQNCAVTIFEEAVNNVQKRTNKTFRGKELDRQINKLFTNFQCGKMGWKDII